MDNIPSYVGMYAAFGGVDGPRSYPLAFYPRSWQKRSSRKSEKQESGVGLYGYSDDAYMYFPAV